MTRSGGNMKLAGKKALVTGGNSGIGLATARLLIAEGAQVAITGRDQKTLDEAVVELGPNARGYRADVTVAEDRKRLFATLANDFGKLDIVFANAGISGWTPTGATDEAIFENVIHTNSRSGPALTMSNNANGARDTTPRCGHWPSNGSVLHSVAGKTGSPMTRACTWQRSPDAPLCRVALRSRFLQRKRCEVFVEIQRKIRAPRSADC